MGEKRKRCGALCGDTKVWLFCSGAGAPQQTSLVQSYGRGIYKPFFKKSFSKCTSDKRQSQKWLHLQAGTYQEDSFAVAAPSCLQHKRGKQPLQEKKKKKRQYFHLKAGRKHARQFVCGPKAAHLRQKGKLYLFNFPRQTSHNSEHSFAISCKELSFSCCNLCSFISSLPSPLLLSLSITRPIHGYPLKCPICRGVAVLAFTSSYRTF